MQTQYKYQKEILNLTTINTKNHYLETNAYKQNSTLSIMLYDTALLLNTMPTTTTPNTHIPSSEISNTLHTKTNITQLIETQTKTKTKPDSNSDTNIQITNTNIQMDAELSYITDPPN